MSSSLTGFMLTRGLVRLGPRTLAATVREQLWFTKRFLGLCCPTASAPPFKPAKVELRMEPVGQGFHGFSEALAEARGEELLELALRQRMLDAQVRTPYVAVTPEGEAIYAQWLVTAEDWDALEHHSPGRYLRLAADEALVEGAFTFRAFRGCGAMADGMGQLVARARAAGVERVFTYVAEDNVPSLRGCARVGFDLHHVRENRRRLLRRSSLVHDPDDAARAAWRSAVGG